MAEYTARQGHQVILSGSMGNFTLSQERSMQTSRLSEDLREWLRSLIGPQAQQARRRRHLLTRDGRTQLYRTRRFTRHARKQRLLQGFMAAKGMDIEATFKNAFGVEHWIPVADYDFVRFVWNLPPNLFRNAAGNRRLVREIMGDCLPERVWDQRFRGAQGPDAFDWYCDELQAIRNYYSKTEHQQPALWDKQKLAEFINRTAHQQQQQEEMLVSVLSCYHLDRLLDHTAQTAVRT